MTLASQIANTRKIIVQKKIKRSKNKSTEVSHCGTYYNRLAVDIASYKVNNKESLLFKTNLVL